LPWKHRPFFIMEKGGGINKMEMEGWGVHKASL
jgi:hypothetical protein